MVQLSTISHSIKCLIQAKYMQTNRAKPAKINCIYFCGSLGRNLTTYKLMRNALKINHLYRGWGGQPHIL